MNPDPTVTLSCDYLVELTDDAEQPNQQPTVVLVLPPPFDTNTPAESQNPSGTGTQT